jgi:hypothetical protein
VQDTVNEDATKIIRPIIGSSSISHNNQAALSTGVNGVSAKCQAEHTATAFGR